LTSTLERILDEYAQELKYLFGDELLGVYLTGSIALGGYHDRKSDIDFTVLIQNKLAASQTASLKTIHDTIKKSIRIIRWKVITSPRMNSERKRMQSVRWWRTAGARYRGRITGSVPSHGIHLKNMGSLSGAYRQKNLPLTPKKTYWCSM